ncbi:MAG: hypothetical protein LBU77_01845 [Clostridiales bacterium]|jgi:hypothetical protein|nr:hypothetical protein [Clostridiales bacterium]
MKVFQTIQKQSMEAEIEKRLKEMASAGYPLPKRFQKSDYITAAVVVLCCLALMIGGYYL